MRAVLAALLLGFAAWRSLPSLTLLASTLRGVGFPDCAQDYLGARALLAGGPLYPALGEAGRALGIESAVNHASTHLPTAYLLALPVAALPWPLAYPLWLALMWICMALAARLYGLPWRLALLIAALALLWPPALWSLAQLTPVWLLGLALAWHYRERPALAGAAVVLAALPKGFAALGLAPFLLRRQTPALLGAAAVGLLALALLLALRPSALAEYMSANAGESLRQMGRPDNGALLPALWQWAGWPGLLPGAALVLTVLWRSLSPAPEAQAWAGWTWLGVALLPIAWVYSLLPLAPWLLWRLGNGSPLGRISAALALLAPLLSPIPGAGGPPVGVLLCLVLSALAISPTWRSDNRSHSASPHSPGCCRK